MKPYLGLFLGRSVVWTGVERFSLVPLAIARQGRIAVDQYIEGRCDGARPQKSNDYIAPRPDMVSDEVRDEIVALAAGVAQ